MTDFAKLTGQPPAIDDSLEAFLCKPAGFKDNAEGAAPDFYCAAAAFAVVPLQAVVRPKTSRAYLFSFDFLWVLS